MGLLARVEGVAGTLSSHAVASPQPSLAHFYCLVRGARLETVQQ